MEAASYSLVYGMEAILPVEIAISSLWVFAESYISKLHIEVRVGKGLI